MTFAPLMQACADVIFGDVLRTTGLQLALTVWDDPAGGMGAVVHDHRTIPTQPVWEAVGYRADGDCLALHPPHQHRLKGRWELPSPETETTTDIAGAIQDLVVMLLWQHGLDATWPACPDHPGGHPLRAGYLERRPQAALPHLTPPASSTVSVWKCPVGPSAIVIGDLRPNHGPPPP